MATFFSLNVPVDERLERILSEHVLEPHSRTGQPLEPLPPVECYSGRFKVSVRVQTPMAYDRDLEVPVGGGNGQVPTVVRIRASDRFDDIATVQVSAPDRYDGLAVNLLKAFSLAYGNQIEGRRYQRNGLVIH